MATSNDNRRRRPDQPRPSRHDLVRQAHVQQVFDVIVAAAPVSRVEIGELTGLSKPTVLSVVDDLETEGLVRSSTPMTGAVGRAPALYEPDPTVGYVAGVDLGGSKVHVAVADLAGTIVGEEHEPTTRGGSEALIDQLDRMLRSAAANGVVQWAQVLSATVGSPGVVGPDGTVSLAANIPGLETLALGAELARRVGVDVAVENDVNLAALGELEAGAAVDCQTFVVLSVGTGIGMGVVLERKLFRGAHGGAGEIAYLPIGADPRSAGARSRGALELAASGSAVRKMLGMAIADHPDAAQASSLTASSTARAVYEAAAGGDEFAASVVARHAEVLAESVLAIAATIDPEVVVLTGGIGSNPFLLEPVRDAVARVSPFPIRVESTTLGARAGLVGAIAHARAAGWRLLGARHQLRGTPLPLPATSSAERS